MQKNALALTGVRTGEGALLGFGLSLWQCRFASTGTTINEPHYSLIKTHPLEQPQAIFVRREQFQRSPRTA